MTAPVFIVDDDADHLAAAADLVEAAGYDVMAFTGAESALEAIKGSDPGVILTDLRMPGVDGFGFIAALKELRGDHPVIVMTGHGDIAQAVRAIREGAEDFLEKPYDANHLLLVIGRTLKARQTRDELRRLQNRLAGSEEIIGNSPAMVALRARVAALAPLDVNVLVNGDTGTGKELVAHILHASGPRCENALVALNCAALPENLFEIEMFGHAAGAFPGALQEKVGKLELASGGTLLLDEIDAMPKALQAKLLRVLDQCALERLGENRLRPLNLRVVATSKVDIKAMAFSGEFRSDLYYRLAGAEIVTTPLRDMGGDIAVLFEHFVTRAAQRHNRPSPDIPIGLRARLSRQSWSGNARELRAAAERLVLGLDIGGTENEPQSLSSTQSLAERVADFEAREIRHALEKCHGNTEKAADLLGLPRRTLNDKIKRLGIKL